LPFLATVFATDVHLKLHRKLLPLQTLLFDFVRDTTVMIAVWLVESLRCKSFQYAIFADRDLHRFLRTQRACPELFEGVSFTEKRGFSLPFGCSTGRLFGRSE
jgi:hypothetical protein